MATSMPKFCPALTHTLLAFDTSLELLRAELGPQLALVVIQSALGQRGGEGLALVFDELVNDTC